MKKLLSKIMNFFKVNNPEEKTRKHTNQDYFEYLPENKIVGLNYEIGIFKIY